MKVPAITDRRVIITLVLILVITLAVVAFAWPVWHNDAKGGQVPNGATAPKQQDTSKQIAGSQQPQTTPDQQPVAESASPACRQFTLPLAKQVLGNTASLDQTNSTVISETADMLVSSCAYAAGNTNTARVEAYSAKTSLGQSANTIVFGSGKPADVQDVPGHGQTAYWDNAAKVLFVLKNNNRYDISLASGDQNDVLRAASVIVPKL
jgi:hypothetical protein